MVGFEGIGDFDSDDPYQRYIAHQAAKGNYPARDELEVALVKAYDHYSIVVHDDEYVEVFWQTNDNLDTGYPGQQASDRYEFTGPNAKEQALKLTGRSRQGIGHEVTVTLDGERI